MPSKNRVATVSPGPKQEQNCSNPNPEAHGGWRAVLCSVKVRRGRRKDLNGQGLGRGKHFKPWCRQDSSHQLKPSSTEALWDPLTLEPTSTQRYPPILLFKKKSVKGAVLSDGDISKVTGDRWMRGGGGHTLRGGHRRVADTHSPPFSSSPPQCVRLTPEQ